jgi:hypothetical protein
MIPTLSLTEAESLASILAKIQSPRSLPYKIQIGCLPKNFRPPSFGGQTKPQNYSPLSFGFATWFDI